MSRGYLSLRGWGSWRALRSSWLFLLGGRDQRRFMDYVTREG